LRRGDAPAHDVLLCIGTGKTVQDTSRMKFLTDEFYVKSAEEMRTLFADVPDACDNTLAIADRIDIRLPEKQFNIPVYPVPSNGSQSMLFDERTPDSYLRELSEIGLVERYGAERAANDVALRERLEYELGVIISMGLASYFLIVWDFIKYARDHDIPVGPGRGSAAGSVVSYILHITDLDPLKFGLIFERFLNPDRISMPDIDTDFCVERRDEVIKYVIEKYGKDHVAQIVTFGTMAARAAVRDAGRALAVPLMDVDRVAKLIPPGPGVTIEKAFKDIPELKALYDVSPQIRQLLDTAKSIEGLARHASTHAAGVVISKDPLIDNTPLIRLGDDEINTQYDMGWVERIGLLKMDFLGLRNLTVMKNAVDEIRRVEKPDFELAKIPDDDRRTYEMLGRGETTGVFQLESDGMRRVVSELRPTEFNDIIALVALYRPGPMEWIPQYISNKHGRTKPRYVHPKLEPILSATYGVACYQEQVMQIARDIAGFSMSEGDELRQVMGKKQKEKIPRYREKFVTGAIAQGIEKKTAEEIFQFVEPFAGYGFPKAHAAAYGWISYQTAYLKANYPRAYLAALMTSVKDKTDKLVEYIDEARRVGIAVLPPDVNESLTDFTVVGEDIRFGLSAVKGVGAGAVASMIDARGRGGPFVDFFDFVKRLDLRQLNRKVFEALIKCGALDSLPGNRAQLLEALDGALEIASRDARDRESGQASLFGIAETEHEELKPQLRFLPAPPLLEALGWEKETLGIFVSGHPLADVAEALARGGAIPIKELRGRQEGEPVIVAGLLTAVRRTMTKAQQQMLIATIEDMSGSVECIVFPKDYPQLQATFVPDAIVTLKGRVRFRERRGTIPGDEAPVDLSVTVNEVRTFERRDLPPPPKSWHVNAQSHKEIDALARLLDEWPGTVPVLLHVGETVEQMPRGVAAAVSVRHELETIFGNARVWEG
jgi:DNA polymerase-3 subunit alpha